MKEENALIELDNQKCLFVQSFVIFRIIVASILSLHLRLFLKQINTWFAHDKWKSENEQKLNFS